MGKKSKKILHEAFYEAISYRWEFIRRSPQYRRDYEVLQKSKNKQERQKAIWKKYKVLPFNYNLSANQMFDLAARVTPNKELTEDEEGASLFMASHSIVGYIAAEVAWSKDSLSISTEDLKKMKFTKINYGRDNCKGINTLRIDINLNFSKEKLLYWIERIINQYKEKCIKQDYRSRLDMFDTYLQIYDLRKSGKTFKEIALIAYPNEYNNLNSTIQKVKRNYKEASRIINGAFQEIR